MGNYLRSAGIALFRNLNGKFQHVGAPAGSALAYAWSSRGLAIGDLDGDGRPDIVINNLDSKPTVLRQCRSLNWGMDRFTIGWRPYEEDSAEMRSEASLCDHGLKCDSAAMLLAVAGFLLSK